MTPHPGLVKAAVAITLPRPRDPLSVEFLQLQKELLRQLGHETGASRSDMLGANQPA
jgi:NitT/TauT family transport system ATP-binding protein